MSKHKHPLQKKFLAIFLCAILIVGMNPVQIHAADEDLVTFVYKIPILGYYEDEAPTGFGGRISTSYKTDKNRSHLSYWLDDPAVTIDWDSKTKTFSYSVTVDRNEDGWVNTLIDFPDNRTGHGAQGITIPSGTDTFTFIQGDGYPDNPYCGSQAINIRLMLDKDFIAQLRILPETVTNLADGE